MEDRVGEVVQGYVTLTSSLLEQWGAHASKMAARIEAGGYDAASAAEDLTACATLATEGGFLWAAEAFQAAAILGGGVGATAEPPPAPFTAPPETTLKLAGPLSRGPNLDQLPVADVTIEPAQLGPNQTEFALSANAAGHRGGTYVGTVEASTAAGVMTPVTVWIVVP